jgi:hypothetical protein
MEGARGDRHAAVPDSFDAGAQRLTITAAEEAGFPGRVRLLEEPQAAFYCGWNGTTLCMSCSGSTITQAEVPMQIPPRPHALSRSAGVCMT